MEYPPPIRPEVTLEKKSPVKLKTTSRASANWPKPPGRRERPPAVRKEDQSHPWDPTTRIEKSASSEPLAADEAADQFPSSEPA